MKKRILPRRDHEAGCVLRLSAPERALLANLPREIDDVLAALASADEAGSPADETAVTADERGPLPPSLKRLFPPAYTRDDEAERKYISEARASLMEHHREALQMLAATASAKTLDAEQLELWMTAINDVRLVLGTVLDVREDGEPPDGPIPQQLVYYYYLSGLQDELIGYLSGWLPDPVPGADDLAPEDPWGEPLGGLRWDGTPLPQGPSPDTQR